MTLTLEEMITNAINNPDKKFRYNKWDINEYIYWDNNKHHFIDEADYIYIIDDIVPHTGWIEFIEEHDYVSE